MDVATSSSIRSLWLIFRFELEGLLLSKKGWLYLFAYSFCWGVLLSNVMSFDGDITSVEFNIGLSMFFKTSLFLFPIMCLFISSNQTGLDRGRGTLRFLSLRVSRDVIFFGRFLFQVFIIFCLIAATVSSLTLVLLLKDAVTVDTVLVVSALNAIKLFLMVLPFIALMTALSAAIESPRHTTLIAGLLWIMTNLILSFTAHKIPALDKIEYLILGRSYRFLLLENETSLLMLASLPILQTAVLLLIGRYIMKRTSL